jgi:hypothetical protein
MPTPFVPVKDIPIITIRISANLFRYWEKKEGQIVWSRIIKKPKCLLFLVFVASKSKKSQGHLRYRAAYLLHCSIANC